MIIKLQKLDEPSIAALPIAGKGWERQPLRVYSVLRDQQVLLAHSRHQKNADFARQLHQNQPSHFQQCPLHFLGKTQPILRAKSFCVRPNELY